MLELNKIYNEDCLETMKRMEDKSINMVMTSPPYWALRDYGTGKDQLGLEPTFDLYIQRLCDIFDEVKRVLRDDGTIWINLGDTYGGGGSSENKGFNDRWKGKDSKKDTEKQNQARVKPLMTPTKSLTMIPFRFAIEMVNRGWILRNTIIWRKRNCMPSSVKDRFTVNYEYLFFFSKKKKYYFEMQLENRKYDYNKSIKYDLKGNPSYKAKVNIKRGYKNKPDVKHPHGSQYHGQNVTEYDQGRNKRTVWTINPTPFPEAHFAVYPEELCETPIKAGCPEFICKKCKKPIERIIVAKGGTIGRSWHDHKDDLKVGQRTVNQAKRGGGGHGYKKIDKGYTDCGCNVGFESGIVYDPFMGSGTTGLVAHKLNRKFVGSEISKEYCKIAEKRLSPELEQMRFA